MLQQRLREVEVEYEAAERERLAVESELDANEHHIADLQPAIERLTDVLEQARREMHTAQARRGTPDITTGHRSTCGTCREVPRTGKQGANGSGSRWRGTLT